MKKILSVVTAFIVICALLFGCGAQKDASLTESTSYDSAASPGAEYSNVSAEKTDSGSGAANAGVESAEFGQKIIYNTRMNIETLKFDESYAALMAQLKKVGGYASVSETYGGYTGSNGSYQTKSAYFEFRVPSAKYEEFLDMTGECGNVTSRSDTTEDITSAYIDTEARLHSLETQETRLLALLEKADSLEAIIALEERLSDVRYQIESYTSTIKTYDKLVAFSTVTVNLSEVSTITVQTKSFGGELVEAVKGSARSVVLFLRGLVLVLVYALPYLIIGFVVFVVVRKIVQKKKALRMQMMNAIKDQDNNSDKA